MKVSLVDGLARTDAIRSASPAPSAVDRRVLVEIRAAFDTDKVAPKNITLRKAHDTIEKLLAERDGWRNAYTSEAVYRLEANERIETAEASLASRSDGGEGLRTDPAQIKRTIALHIEDVNLVRDAADEVFEAVVKPILAERDRLTAALGAEREARVREVATLREEKDAWIRRLETEQYRDRTAMDIIERASKLMSEDQIVGGLIKRAEAAERRCEEMAGARVEALRDALACANARDRGTPDQGSNVARAIATNIQVLIGRVLSAERDTTETGWRPISEKPASGRRIAVLYDDGSGAGLFYVHDDGVFDQDGDEYGSLSKNYEWWTYLPQGFRLWCEDNGEDPLIFPDAPPPPVTPGEKESER